MNITIVFLSYKFIYSQPNIKLLKMTKAEIVNKISSNLGLEKNEVLAIMTCGAYGSVMRSNYNSRPSAAEVFIFNNKEILLRKREKIDQLLNLDIIPNF